MQIISMKKYIFLLTLYSTISTEILTEIKWLESITKAAQCSLLIASVKKYSGSHCEFRLAGAEYKINDGLLKNQAAHSGLPYIINKHRNNDPDIISDKDIDGMVGFKSFEAHSNESVV